MVDLDLQFFSIDENMQRSKNFEKPATFYEAEIKVDAIISYPWLLENKLGVIPHRRALAMEDPEPALLTGLHHTTPKFQKKRVEMIPKEEGSTR